MYIHLETKPLYGIKDGSSVSTCSNKKTTKRRKDEYDNAAMYLKCIGCEALENGIQTIEKYFLNLLKRILKLLRKLVNLFGRIYYFAINI